MDLTIKISDHLSNIKKYSRSVCPKLKEHYIKSAKHMFYSSCCFWKQFRTISSLSSTIIFLCITFIYKNDWVIFTVRLLIYKLTAHKIYEFDFFPCTY